jgi:hypothetical protein
MHHSHATLTVTSLPSGSYLTWGSVLETSRLRLCGQNGGAPSPASVVPEGGSGETRMDRPSSSNRAFHWPPLTAPERREAKAQFVLERILPRGERDEGAPA